MRSKASQLSYGDEGSVLVLALWAVTAAALGAAAIIAIGQVQQKLARNDAEALRQELALQSGIQVVLYGLVSRPADWTVDGRSRSLTIGSERIGVVVTDEAGKIDINVASEDLLLGLLGPVKAGNQQKQIISAAIQDWRDRDDERRLLGSEKADYASGGYKYEPRNRPFANPAELQRVAGMTPDLYRQLGSALTVYSQRAGVDGRVAAPDVLRRLPGMEDASAIGVVQVRDAGSDASGATTHIGRTIAIRATLPGRPGMMEWNAVVRLVGARREQLRIMAWHSEPVAN
jgi:general secretion pathway protein K